MYKRQDNSCQITNITEEYSQKLVTIFVEELLRNPVLRHEILSNNVSNQLVQNVYQYNHENEIIFSDEDIQQNTQLTVYFPEILDKQLLRKDEFGNLVSTFNESLPPIQVQQITQQIFELDEDKIQDMLDTESSVSSLSADSSIKQSQTRSQLQKTPVTTVIFSTIKTYRFTHQSLEKIIWQ